MTITAAPAQHGVYEIMFVLQSGRRLAYFVGDTLSIPELHEMAPRPGHLDASLLPANGLCIRPQHGKQGVMKADDAACLAGSLKADPALPRLYAFSSGWLAERLLTGSDRRPQAFVGAVHRLAPEVEVQARQPATTVVV